MCKDAFLGIMDTQLQAERTYALEWGGGQKQLPPGRTNTAAQNHFGLLKKYLP